MYRIFLFIYTIFHNSGDKLQSIGKDGGKFFCRDGLEGCNPQEEKYNSSYCS
jgi:hypothetical protein